MEEDDASSPQGSHTSHQSPPSAARLALQALQEIGTPSLGNKSEIVSPGNYHQESPLTRLQVIGIGLGLGGGVNNVSTSASSVVGAASAVDEGAPGLSGSDLGGGVEGAGGGGRGGGGRGGGGGGRGGGGGGPGTAGGNATASADVTMDISADSFIKPPSNSSFTSQLEMYALARTPPHTGGGRDGNAGSAAPNMLTFTGADSLSKRAGGDRDSGRVSIGSIGSAPRSGSRGHCEFAFLWGCNPGGRRPTPLLASHLFSLLPPPHSRLSSQHVVTAAVETFPTAVVFSRAARRHSTWTRRSFPPFPRCLLGRRIPTLMQAPARHRSASSSSSRCW